MGIADKIRTLAATTAAATALAMPAYAQQKAEYDCSDKTVQEKIFSQKVDRTTDWTPNSFEALFKSGKPTLIHWRLAPHKVTPEGDRYFCDLMQNYGDLFENYVTMELANMPNRGRVFREIAGKYDRSRGEEGTVTAPSSFSIINKDGTEVRIRGPPFPHQYSYAFTDKYDTHRAMKIIRDINR